MPEDRVLPSSARGWPLRLLVALTELTNRIGTIWIFALMLLICSDILGRNLFRAPITGVFEIVTASIVCIVFLQLPDAMRRGKLTRSDGLLGTLGARAPHLRRALDIFAHLLGAAMLGLIGWGTAFMLGVAIERGYFIGAQGGFTIPSWTVHGTVLLGSLLTMLHFLRKAWLLSTDPGSGDADARVTP